MDDPAQDSQNTQPGAQQAPPSPQSVHDDQHGVQPVPPPVAATSSLSKEHAPVVQAEHVVSPAPHEAAPVVSEKVASHVEVSPNPEQPQISQQVREMGVREAGPAAPAPTALSSALPQTREEIELKEKASSSPLESLSWSLRVWGRQIRKQLFGKLLQEKR